MSKAIFESLVECVPSDLLREVERELLNGWRLREVKSKADAMQNAAFLHAHEAHHIEGLGQLRMRIPEDSYHYWGQRLGYECWEDNQFLKEFEKDNPEVAVKNYAKKTVVNGAIFTADGILCK